VNRPAWREAWRWQREDAAVPWLRRVGLAVVLSALLVVAGWGKPDVWWIVGGFSVAWLGLVVAGVRQDVQAATRRMERSEGEDERRQA
jgi:hypothetical protein